MGEELTIMENTRRLDKIQSYMENKGWKFTYGEDEGLGSVEFLYRDRAYHVWEFCDDDGTWGCESNVRTCGRMEDFLDDYEDQVLAIIEEWLAEERINAEKEARAAEEREKRINRQW